MRVEERKVETVGPAPTNIVASIPLGSLYAGRVSAAIRHFCREWSMPVGRCIVARFDLR